MDSHKKSSFVKQASMLAAAALIVRFIGFLYRLPLTDMIGDEGNGIYAVGYNVYNLLLIMSSAGLPVAISRMVSERISLGQHKEAHRVFRVALMVAGISGLVCCLLLGFGAGFFASLFGDSRSYYTIVTLAPTTLIVAIAAVFRGYFQGRSNTAPSAVSQVIEQIFNAVFSIVLAFWFMNLALGYPDADVDAFGAAGGTAGTGVGALFGLLIIVWIYRAAKPSIDRKLKNDSTPFNIQSNKELALMIIKTAAPIIAGTAIFSFSNLIDTAMVMNRLTVSGSFTLKQATAMFGILNGKYVTITTLPITISTSFAVAAIPGIAAAVALKRKKEVNYRINAAIRMAMLLSIPAAVGIGVLADPILHMLFPKYPEGALLLQVGSVSIIFLALTQIVTGMLQGIGRLKGPIIGAVLGVLIKIPINYVLIANPDINIVGAVIGTICCYVAASSFDLYFLIKATKIKFDFITILGKPLIASGVMGLACYVSYYFMQYLLNKNAISIFFSIISGIFIYFTFMILQDGLEEEDLRRLPLGSNLCDFLKKNGLLQRG